MSEKWVCEPYLAFLRTKCCFLSGAGAPSEVHHIVHVAWRESMRNDALGVPVSREVHRCFHDMGVAETLKRYNATPITLAKEIAANLVEYFEGKKTEGPL